MDDVVPNQATLQRGSREVLKDPVLGTRVRSRACYRDKSQGQGELRAKTRVVVLGQRSEPDGHKPRGANSNSLDGTSSLDSLHVRTQQEAPPK
jgi:hypothetical protein